MDMRELLKNFQLEDENRFPMYTTYWLKDSNKETAIETYLRLARETEEEVVQDFERSYNIFNLADVVTGVMLAVTVTANHEVDVEVALVVSMGDEESDKGFANIAMTKRDAMWLLREKVGLEDVDDMTVIGTITMDMDKLFQNFKLDGTETFPEEVTYVLLDANKETAFATYRELTKHSVEECLKDVKHRFGYNIISSLDEAEGVSLFVTRTANDEVAVDISITISPLHGTRTDVALIGLAMTKAEIAWLLQEKAGVEVDAEDLVLLPVDN